MANVKLLNAQGQPVVYSNVNQVTLYNEADQPVVFSIDSAPPTETLNVSDNGTVNVLNYAWANVNVTADKVDAGQVSITSNGIHNVVGAAQAVVNVPSQGITPSGSVTIDHNGTFDVTDKASVIVNIAASTLVSGTLNITRNGNFDVTEKASAAVNIPASETDTLGAKSISANGTYDVIGYSSAVVNVESNCDMIQNNSYSFTRNLGWRPDGLYMHYLEENEDDGTISAQTWFLTDTGEIAHNEDNQITFTSTGYTVSLMGSDFNDSPELYSDFIYTAYRKTN